MHDSQRSPALEKTSNMSEKDQNKKKMNREKTKGNSKSILRNLQGRYFTQEWNVIKKEHSENQKRTLRC